MFGIKMGSMTVSCVGQADDSVLLSHDIHQLGHLLHLTAQYCSKYKVEMTPEKTKLQVFAPASLQTEVSYSKSINYLSISGVPLHFSDITEHVGVIRSPESNMPHILQRISSHCCAFCWSLKKTQRKSGCFIESWKALCSSCSPFWSWMPIPTWIWSQDSFPTLQRCTWISPEASYENAGASCILPGWLSPIQGIPPHPAVNTFFNDLQVTDKYLA